MRTRSKLRRYVALPNLICVICNDSLYITSSLHQRNMSYRTSELARLLADLEAAELSLRTSRVTVVDQMAKTLSHIILSPETTELASLGTLDRKRRRLLEFGDRLARETVAFLTEVSQVNDLTDMAVDAVARARKTDESPAKVRSFDAVTGRDFVDRYRGGRPLPSTSLDFSQNDGSARSDRGYHGSVSSNLDSCDPFLYVDTDVEMKSV